MDTVVQPGSKFVTGVGENTPLYDDNEQFFDVTTADDVHHPIDPFKLGIPEGYKIVEISSTDCEKVAQWKRGIGFLATGISIGYNIAYPLVKLTGEDGAFNLDAITPLTPTWGGFLAVGIIGLGLVGASFGISYWCKPKEPDTVKLFELVTAARIKQHHIPSSKQKNWLSPKDNTHSIVDFRRDNAGDNQTDTLDPNYREYVSAPGKPGEPGNENVAEFFYTT